MANWFKRALGRCKYCSRPYFNKEAEWSKKNMCIYCYEAEERGRRSETYSQ